MSFLPKEELEPKDRKKGPSFNRIAMWVIVGGVGVYLVVSGLLGVMSE
jgi:hypothetical protein